jgi:hypothetical protein
MRIYFLRDWKTGLQLVSALVGGYWPTRRLAVTLNPHKVLARRRPAKIRGLRRQEDQLCYKSQAASFQ